MSLIVVTGDNKTKQKLTVVKNKSLLKGVPNFFKFCKLFFSDKLKTFSLYEFLTERYERRPDCNQPRQAAGVDWHLSI